MLRKERSRMYLVNRTILHIGIIITLFATYLHNFYDFGSDGAKMVYYVGNSLGLALIGYYLYVEVRDPIVSFWFFWQVFLVINRAFLEAEIGLKSLMGLAVILIVCIYRNGKRTH